MNNYKTIFFTLLLCGQIAQASVSASAAVLFYKVVGQSLISGEQALPHLYNYGCKFAPGIALSATALASKALWNHIRTPQIAPNLAQLSLPDQLLQAARNTTANAVTDEEKVAWKTWNTTFTRTFNSTKTRLNNNWFNRPALGALSLIIGKLSHEALRPTMQALEQKTAAAVLPTGVVSKMWHAGYNWFFKTKILPKITEKNQVKLNNLVTINRAAIGLGIGFASWLVHSWGQCKIEKHAKITTVNHLLAVYNQNQAAYQNALPQNFQNILGAVDDTTDKVALFDTLEKVFKIRVNGQDALEIADTSTNGTLGLTAHKDRFSIFETVGKAISALTGAITI